MVENPSGSLGVGARNHQGESHSNKLVIITYTAAMMRGDKPFRAF